MISRLINNRERQENIKIMLGLLLPHKLVDNDMNYDERNFKK